MHGVPNDIVYEMQAKLRRPSYSIGENKLKLQGLRAGTIEANIPIKPKVNLIGQVGFTSKNKMTELDKNKVYEKMSVRIRNSKEEHIETLLVEADGSFILSDIYPDKYELEIIYWGKDREIPTKIIPVDVVYLDGEDEIFEINFDLNK